jgi:hypothetical protein
MASNVLVSCGYIWRCLLCGKMDGAYDAESDAIKDGNEHKKECDSE